MDFENLRVKMEDKIATLTLNRPDALNSLNSEMLEELEKSLTDLRENSDIRAIIITGAGEKAFCAGADLKELPKNPEEKLEDFMERIQKFQVVTRLIRETEKPVIAAVNGYAMGGGCDIALSCDLRYASENAVFAESFVNAGLIPADGGVYYLTRIVGEARAKELTFTGKRIKTQEALNLGLVNEVVPQDRLLEFAEEKAKALASGPTVAIAQAKSLINEAFEVDLNEELERALIAQRICSQTKNHKEALEAFEEKREPEFKGE